MVYDLTCVAHAIMYDLTGVAYVKVYDLTCVAHAIMYDLTCVLQVWHMSRCMILHVCYRCGTCQGI